MKKMLVIGNPGHVSRDYGSGVVLWDFLAWFSATGFHVSFLSASKVIARQQCCRQPTALRPPGVDEWLPGYVATHAYWWSQALPPYGHTLWRRLTRQRILHLPSGNYDQIMPDADAAWLADQIHRERFDIVIADYVWCAPVLRHLHGSTIRKGILAHDLMALRHQSMQSSGARQDIADDVIAEERDLMSAADFVLMETMPELEAAAAWHPDKRFFLMPRVAHETPLPRSAMDCTNVLFIGAAASHNLQGLHWFLDHVWPLVLTSVPQAVFTIVGGCGPALQRTAPNVVLTGKVDDLAAYYAGAALCVVPLLSGSGFKTKLIEALGHGRACVSTSVGAMGLPLDQNCPATVRDEPQAFAAEIIRLLTDTTARHRLEGNAATYVRHSHAPDTVYGPVAAYLAA